MRLKLTKLSRRIGDLKITSTSTERQKRSQNLAPVLVIISGKSLVFSRKIITSTDFYRYCAPDASAPVVVINQSPKEGRGQSRTSQHKVALKISHGRWGKTTPKHTPLGAIFRSGPGKPNQKKSVHELFAGAFRNKSSICESCLFS